MKRQPRTPRVVRHPEVGARIGEDMVARENPQCARIEIRTDKAIKDVLQARADEAGFYSLTAFLVERGIAEPTQKERREWKKRLKLTAAKRDFADARKRLREVQGDD